LLIGANNLCESCYDSFDIYDSAAAFEKSLREIVGELQTIPRLFVNLVGIFNISGVYTIALNNTYCRNIHHLVFAECDCALYWSDDNTNRIKMDDTAAAYRNVMKTVARDTPVTDSFALIYQPMLTDMKIQLEFLSTLDCFHPTLYAHQQMGIGLWNSMLLPASQKQTGGVIPVPILFPKN